MIDKFTVATLGNKKYVIDSNRWSYNIYTARNN